MYVMFVFFFKQKTAYEMRISDWSSDVCSSELDGRVDIVRDDIAVEGEAAHFEQLGRAFQLEAVLAGVALEILEDGQLVALLAGRGLEDKIGSASCRERVCPYV